ncbi:glycoside hydrolase family 76 protein [Xylaria flabelliformis]|nr:glycoside hydrolase family 76 protein [Xylaria flabelliformis]KAI0857069.1 family 76 glycoside hydrolase [Xylaria cubensis]
MIPSLVYLLPLYPLAALAALEVDIEDRESIKAAAAQVAEDLLKYYHGHDPGHTIGILPGPPPDGDYYWWEAGAMWGALLDYWHWTGDDTYNNLTYDSLLWQAGPNKDYADKNWTASLGNDDQSFWAMSALIAAEYNFRNPPAGMAQWLALAQAVWTEQTADDLRDGGCGIGLRWQAVSLNPGFSYKNTIANGCFFNIGARLARYTGNNTYMDWSLKTWDWLIDIKYVDDKWNVYDGADISNNCTMIVAQQYSYNAGILLQGAAYLWNYTSDQIWMDRINGLLDGIERVFFIDGVAYEPACEGGVCTADMLTYKGFLHRWMGYTAQLAPSTAGRIMPLLKSSTKAAVAQCTGGDNGRQCGFHWTSGKFDGLLGVGQQMNVLGALSSLLVLDAPEAVTNTTGGTSMGDPHAGSDKVTYNDLGPITTGDKAGAGILTVVIITFASVSLWWMAN